MHPAGAGAQAGGQNAHGQDPAPRLTCPRARPIEGRRISPARSRSSPGHQGWARPLRGCSASAARPGLRSAAATKRRASGSRATFPRPAVRLSSFTRIWPRSPTAARWSRRRRSGSAASTLWSTPLALSDRGDIFDTTEERFDEIFDVNVRAPFFLIQESVRIMRREKIAGAIVNIQSMSGHGGQPFIAAYCASKGALATLTRM